MIDLSYGDLFCERDLSRCEERKMVAARVPNRGSHSGRGRKDARVWRRHEQVSACGCAGLGHGWVLGSGDGEKERFHLKRWGAGQGGAEIKKLKSRLSDSYLIFFF